MILPSRRFPKRPGAFFLLNLPASAIDAKFAAEAPSPFYFVLYRYKREAHTLERARTGVRKLPRLCESLTKKLLQLSRIDVIFIFVENFAVEVKLGTRIHSGHSYVARD